MDDNTDEKLTRDFAVGALWDCDELLGGLGTSEFYQVVHEVSEAMK